MFLLSRRQIDRCDFVVIMLNMKDFNEVGWMWTEKLQQGVENLFIISFLIYCFFEDFCLNHGQGW